MAYLLVPAGPPIIQYVDPIIIGGGVPYYGDVYWGGWTGFDVRWAAHMDWMDDIIYDCFHAWQMAIQGLSMSTRRQKETLIKILRRALPPGTRSDAFDIADRIMRMVRTIGADEFGQVSGINQSSTSSTTTTTTTTTTATALQRQEVAQIMQQIMQSKGASQQEVNTMLSEIQSGQKDGFVIQHIEALKSTQQQSTPAPQTSYASQQPVQMLPPPPPPPPPPPMQQMQQFGTVEHITTVQQTTYTHNYQPQQMMGLQTFGQLQSDPGQQLSMQQSSYQMQSGQIQHGVQPSGSYAAPQSASLPPAPSHPALMASQAQQYQDGGHAMVENGGAYMAGFPAGGFDASPARGLPTGPHAAGPMSLQVMDGEDKKKSSKHKSKSSKPSSSTSARPEAVSAGLKQIKGSSSKDKEKSAKKKSKAWF